MPRLVDGESRTELVARAINDVLAEDGIPALTMRAIADRVRLSASALHVHYGSRERMLMVIASFTGDARVLRIEQRVQDEGFAAFLPIDDEDLVDLRAWLGWCELARSSIWLTASIDDVLARERAVLARAVAYRLARPELDWLAAVIDGLAVAVCRPVRPMSRERARDLLTRAVRELLPDEVPPAPPPWASIPHLRRDRPTG